MTIQDETTKEHLTKTTIKLIGRTTHASIETIRNELDKIRALIKTLNTEFPEGMEFGYATEIMTAREYQKGLISIDPAWTVVKSTKPESYNLSMQKSTAELTKSNKEVLWEL